MIEMFCLLWAASVSKVGKDGTEYIDVAPIRIHIGTYCVLIAFRIFAAPSLPCCSAL